MGKWFLCKLKPLESYFFGGEHIFDLAGEEKSYYIKSERMPTQSTLLGMLRFLVLSKAGLLNDTAAPDDPRSFRDAKKKLIGENGFIIDGPMDSNADYGEILALSPAFLMDADRHRWIRTPFNHIKHKKSYTPFTMKKGPLTDIGCSPLLPKEYREKEGLSDSFLDIDSFEHPVRECGAVGGKDNNNSGRRKLPLFSFEEHTRIYRHSDEEGYFKKSYISLDPEFSFSFYCEMRTRDALPEKETVYLGQEKSAFFFSCEEMNDSTDPVQSLEKKIGELNGGPHGDVYYAASDMYLSNGINKQGMLFSIVETKPFRTLTQNPSGGSDFRNSRIRSDEYQLVQAGSVFYLEKGSAGGLLSEHRLEGMQQAGFNYLFPLGGKV